MLLKHYCYRIVEKILKRNNIIITYFTKYGLKNINMGLVAQLSTPYIIEQRKMLGSDLHLGPDFLADEFTLLECNITKSPHYEFVNAFLQGKKVEETEYVKRWESGTLDWRRPMPISLSIDEWKKISKLRINEIRNNKYAPINVYYYGGKYYIYDGKHRAALCSAMNKDVLCNIIPSNYVFDYYCGYMFKRVLNNRSYRKHKDFFEKMNTSEEFYGKFKVEKSL